MGKGQGFERTILITGGAGFIGSCLAERLVNQPENLVVVVDNLLTGELRKLPTPKQGNLVFIRADVNNLEDMTSIFHRYAFDFVFHYAALVGVKRTQAHPIMVLNDVNGFRNILSLSKNTGVQRVFFSSSSEVYGEPVEFPQNELTTPLNSRIPYAIVKNLGEAYFRSYHKEYGLPFTIFRFFNTYGPRQSTDFVISLFISRALRNEDILIYGDGLQTRTFCFIEDNLDATVKALFENKSLNDVVNLGNDEEVTILDLAKTIIQMTGSKSGISHVPRLSEGDMSRRQPDVSKMKELLGRNLVSLEDGLAEILKDTSYIL